MKQGMESMELTYLWAFWRMRDAGRCIVEVDFDPYVLGGLCTTFVF
jgi:hypothetical protein